MHTVADINGDNFEKPIITMEEIRKAAELLKERYDNPFPIDRVFITGGTGVPDSVAVEYFKDTSVIVITRDWSKYQYGKKMEESE